MIHYLNLSLLASSLFYFKLHAWCNDDGAENKWLLINLPLLMMRGKSVASIHFNPQSFDDFYANYQ